VGCGEAVLDYIRVRIALGLVVWALVGFGLVTLAEMLYVLYFIIESGLIMRTETFEGLYILSERVDALGIRKGRCRSNSGLSAREGENESGLTCKGGYIAYVCLVVSCSRGAIIVFGASTLIKTLDIRKDEKGSRSVIGISYSSLLIS